MLQASLFKNCRKSKLYVRNSTLRKNLEISLTQGPKRKEE